MRKRRSAAEAREEILASAQALFEASGPAGVKLDDVAAAVGVSRQAVLHHFGTSDALLRAVVERAWTGLFAELGGLTTPVASPAAFVDRVDAVARREGNARIGAWLLLSGQGLPDEVFTGALSGLAERLGAADPAEARHALLLVAASVFGDALFGGRFRQVLGLPDDEVERAAFRRFVASRAWPENR